MNLLLDRMMMASKPQRQIGITAVLQQYRSSHQPYYFVQQQQHELRSLAYRSVAVKTPTDGELQDLLQAAQQRNRAEGVSGVLLFDHGAYFHWLEGPSAAVDRVWHSISRDTRHHQITVLRDEPISQRLFDGCDLRIVQEPKVSIEAAVAAIYSPSTVLLKHLVDKPASLLRMTWEDVFATSVIPRLLEVHANSLSNYPRRAATPTIWHASLNSGAEFAAALLGRRSAGSGRFVDSLIEEGAGLNALYHEVFEPAQLHLGKLWDTEQCDDFHLSMGLARLLVEVRRANATLPAEHVCTHNQSVLLSLQPTESHGAGLAMSSEIFVRNGWDVTCEFQPDEQTLIDMVHSRWFDVLKVSQSGSVRRDSKLMAMRATIDAVRLASLNPALIVMVDGRTFAEMPLVYRAVHANAASLSILEAVPLAARMLDASRIPTTNVQVSLA